MLTVSTLIEQVQAQVGDGQNVSADDTLYTYWVTEAVQTIWNMWKWRRKYVTATGTFGNGVAEISSPSTISDIHDITRSDGYKLHYKARRDMVNEGLDLTRSGEPHVWYWANYDVTNQDDVIGVWPVPTADYDVIIYGMYKPDAELELADTIPLSEEFLPALKEYVRFKALEAEELFDASDRAWRMFNTQVSLSFDILAKHAEQEQGGLKYNTNNDLKMFAGRRRNPILFYPRIIGDTSTS